MISSRSRGNFKGADVQNIFCSNNREQRKLEGQIKAMNSTARFEMNKINREIFELRKQLMENQKILGTRSDIKRRQKIDFTSDERTETPRLGMRDCHSNFRTTRRHSIANVDTTAQEKSHYSVNSARFIVRKPSSSSSEDTEERKPSFNQPSSYSFTRRRQSISALPSYDKALYNRGEKTARVLGFGQAHDHTGKSQIEKEHVKERPVISRRWSRRHSLPCPAFTNPGEKFFRENETKKRTETPSLHVQTNTQKISIHDSKSPGVQTQDKPNLIFQRRHSTPNYMLPLNREQKDKISLVRTKTRGSNNKLTAKLPTRVASARIREPVVSKVFQTVETTELRKLTTAVEEKNENETEDEGDNKESQAQNKENNLKEVLEETQDIKDEGQEEEKDKEQEEQEEVETSGYGDDETKTLPDELCGIPKITLEEKIEKFFAGAIEFEVAAKISGHYAEVLESYLSDKNED